MRFILSILLISASCVWSQPVFTANDWPTSHGTTVTLAYTSGSVPLNVGSSGANQNWDFSGMVATEPQIQEWISPSGTPYTATFPNANRCVFTGDSAGTTQIFSYSLSTSNEFRWLGSGSDGPGGESITVPVYTHAPTNYPISYLDEWYSVYTLDLGMGLSSFDSTYSRVDGWGTLTDRLGTYQCLRIQNYHSNETFMGGVPVYHYTDWYYQWIVPDVGQVSYMRSAINDPNPNFTEGWFIRMTDLSTGVIGIEEPQLFPVSIVLHPAYPNPFNQEITIRFNLHAANFVSMSVHNILGQEVVQLYNEWLRPATYSTVFNGNNLTSGIYYLRLDSGSFHQIQQIVLIK